MSGVNASATPGGNAIADLRTVYAYAPDGVSDGLGTYQGSAWPYVTTDRNIRVNSFRIKPLQHLLKIQRIKFL